MLEKASIPADVAAPQAPSRGPKRRILRRVGIASASLLLAGAAGGYLWFRSKLLQSLPPMDGRVELAGLAAPVRVERDALGIPGLRGASRQDVALATGFVHAQDRFFQMDLLRRRGAGEIAELLGPAGLENDRPIRTHRLRARAARVLAALPPADRALVAAYTKGVNAGLASLREAPFEYLALGSDPRPWKEEDTVLTLYAMSMHLQDWRTVYESGLDLLHALPAPLFEFLVPRATAWDVPFHGEPGQPAAIPGPEVFDLRRRAVPRAARLGARPGRSSSSRGAEVFVGSNAWVVAGRLADAGGAAMLANDQHMGLDVPNIWYRTDLAWREGGQEHRVVGVTLPGAPFTMIGSNGRIAWGMTNSLADSVDVVFVEPDPRNADLYRTPAGPRRFERSREVVRVRGGPAEEIEAVWTVWGPLLPKDHRGRLRALHWTVHRDGGIDLGLRGLETARNVDEAVAVANRAGLPPLNLLVGDSGGRIAWTIAGYLPKRVGFDGRLPGSWADGARRWEGRLPAAEYPRVIDPPSGRLWSANNRLVTGEMLAKMGDGGYYLASRARQIRDRLFALEKASARDMLAIQLDDRALFLARWRDLLLRELTPQALAADPRRREVRTLVESWGGRASVDSVGYRLVRAFRTVVLRQVFGSLLAERAAADPEFDYFDVVLEEEQPLWSLISKRPPNLLDPRFRTWNEQLLAALDAALDELLQDGQPLREKTWGARNVSLIRHPFSLGVPALGRWLDMPALQLPGDYHMPRLQSQNGGAAQRMVVAPGRESEGIFHMPGGQSGHPASPHYGDGHEVWARGEPRPFLPGPAAHTLELVPAR